MRKRAWVIGLALWGAAAGISQAADWFVATNGSDAAAGTNWATAKQTIQAGVDAAAAGDTVWVSNGIYATGGRKVTLENGLTNRVAIDKAIVVRSVDGPFVTIIQGGPDPITRFLGVRAVRCAYVGTQAVLSGFTLREGFTAEETPSPAECDKGGGAFCEATTSRLIDCEIIGGHGAFGGGVEGGTLERCTLRDNQSPWYGGGARNSGLNNCLIVNNSGFYGGGAAYCNLNNCTVVSNLAESEGGGIFESTANNCILAGNEGGNHVDSTINYSSTVPLPEGTGNITNDPQFVNSGTGDYRLAAGSPCIDAGDVTVDAGEEDLDGQQRVVGSTVDMGAYEHQTADAAVLSAHPASTSLGFGAESGRVISIMANTSWTSTTAVPWLVITSGFTGTTNGIVVFSVASNSQATARTGAIVVAGGGLRRTCTVSQAASAPVLSVSPASTNVGYGPEIGQVNVAANMAWAAVTNVPWLTITSGFTGTNNGAVVFSVTTNLQTTARTGAIVVAGGGLLRTCTVIQAASAPFLSVSPASTNVGDGPASGQSVNVAANMVWAAVTNVPWLRITSGFTGTNNGAVVFSVASNLQTTARTGAIVVAGSGLFRTCTVIQAASAPVLSVSPASTVVGYSAATGRTLSVTANMAWAATTSVPWLAITSGFSGTTNGAIVYNVESNAGSIRAGNIVVAGSGLFRTCTVYQATSQVTDWFVATNGSDAAAGTNWATAKQTIQAALNMAGSGDTVFVADGVYREDLNITNGISLVSVNGPYATIIRARSLRCITITHSNVMVKGFTVTGGFSPDGNGGGIYANNQKSLIDQCWIVSNRCTVFMHVSGGGLYGGTARNCLIEGNYLYADGGTKWTMSAQGAGAANSMLENCNVVGNTARTRGLNPGSGSGDTFNCTYVNSIFWNNSYTHEHVGFWRAFENSLHGKGSHAPKPPDPYPRNQDFFFSSFYPPFSPPYSLNFSHPCINAGTNLDWMTGATDLIGNPRITDGTVDQGCFEYRRPLILAPPALTQPVAVAPGGAGVLRSTNDWFWVHGTKPTNCLVAWSLTSPEGYSTNGIQQEAAGTTWSNLVQRNWQLPDEIKTWFFHCEPVDVQVVGSSSTRLLGTAAGFGGDPQIQITPSGASAKQDTWTLRGFRNRHMLEHLWVSNQANGAVAAFTAPDLPATNWTSASVPLMWGANLLRVYGSNMLGVIGWAEQTVVRESQVGSIGPGGGGQVRIDWTLATNPPQVYQIQRSTNLSDGVWTDWGAAFTATQEMETRFEQTTTNDPVFFRIIQTIE